LLNGELFFFFLWDGRPSESLPLEEKESLLFH
jgi:hypothetical protein